MPNFTLILEIIWIKHAPIQNEQIATHRSPILRLIFSKIAPQYEEQWTQKVEPKIFGIGSESGRRTYMNQFILHCFNSSIFNSPDQLDRDSNRFLRSSSPFTDFTGKRHCRLRFLRSQFLRARFRFRSSEITNLRFAPLLFFDQSSHTDSKWSRRRKMMQKMKNNNANRRENFQE